MTTALQTAAAAAAALRRLLMRRSRAGRFALERRTELSQWPLEMEVEGWALTERDGA